MWPRGKPIALCLIIIVACAVLFAAQAYNLAVGYGIEDIIRLYPQLYSEHRYDAWAKLFVDDAVIYGVGTAGGWSMPIRDFAPLQVKIAAGNKIFRERWENVEQHVFGKVAVIKADYFLETDEGEKSGYDILFLVNGPRGWRIASLAFEEL